MIEFSKLSYKFSVNYNIWSILSFHFVSKDTPGYIYFKWVVIVNFLGPFQFVIGQRHKEQIL